MKKYYVRVTLISYDDKEIASSDCTCEDDITNESVILSAKVAAELLVKHSNNLKIEQNKR